MKKGKMRHMMVSPNDNGGAQIKVHRAMPPMKPGSPMMDMDNGEENLGASTPEEAGAHVARLLKEHQGMTDQPGQSDNASSEMPSSPFKGVFGRKKKN